MKAHEGNRGMPAKMPGNQFGRFEHLFLCGIPFTRTSKKRALTAAVPWEGMMHSFSLSIPSPSLISALDERNKLLPFIQCCCSAREWSASAAAATAEA